MIKIRVVRGIQLGFPIATGLVALSGLVTSACAAHPVDDDGAESDSAELSAAAAAKAGTGVLQFGWAYGTTSGMGFTATNSTDEYVRAQEKMSFNIPAYLIWSQINSTDGMPDDLTRWNKVSVAITVTYFNQGAQVGQSTVTTNAWQGTQLYDYAASTSTFTVHRKAESMKFSLVITDNGTSPPTTKTLDASFFPEQPVFGGTLPNKTLVFDNNGSALRSRVIEGGNALRGANLAIGYTDWRAATLVDSSSIDRQIGTAISHGRFGSFEMPILADLEYEVSYGAAVDNAWQAESALTKNSASRLLPANVGRTAFEGSLAVPAGGQTLQMYFHVKAFLKVDYSRYSDITWKKYNDGDRIMVREKWDNENGAPNDNWDFVTSAK